MYKYDNVICTLHSNNPTDIEKHIDATITYQHKSINLSKTFQIKTIQDMDYNHFTIEYMNNRFTNEWGEIKDIEADYYLHCRVAYDKIWNVGLVNVSKLKEALYNDRFKYTIHDNPDSNANFMCVDWDILNALDGVVVCHHNNTAEYNIAKQIKMNAMIQQIKAEIDNETR
ncbi:MAG: hypothetical protein LCH52_03865 [Bacteroidetes bacterium]|nr:hypothetical protein [Bacteroidota bacterium]